MLPNDSLADYEIGQTYTLLYHLELPYTIGDSRIQYSSVYVDDNIPTGISISPLTIKIGNYIYPYNAIDYNVFYIENSNILQSTNLVFYYDRVKIGENIYILSALRGNNMITQNGQIVSYYGNSIKYKKISYTDVIGEINANSYIRIENCTYNNINLSGHVLYLGIEFAPGGTITCPAFGNISITVNGGKTNYMEIPVNQEDTFISWTNGTLKNLTLTNGTI